MANKPEKKKGDSPGGSILAGMAKRASAARKKERQSPVENGSRNSGPVDLDDSNSEEDSIMGMSAVEEAEGGSLVAGGEKKKKKKKKTIMIV